MARVVDYTKIKVGSLVRWWGNFKHSGNEQDIDDIGLVVREDDYGVGIWWSVTKLENTFDWDELEAVSYTHLTLPTILRV